MLVLVGEADGATVLELGILIAVVIVVVKREGTSNNLKFLYQ